MIDRHGAVERKKSSCSMLESSKMIYSLDLVHYLGAMSPHFKYLKGYKANDITVAGDWLEGWL